MIDLRRAHRPLLITSAISRSGTTVTQSLVNSDPASVIYSEDGALLNLLVQLHARIEFHSVRHVLFERERALYLEDSGAWLRALSPPVPLQISAAYRAAFDLLGPPIMDAGELGKSRWGMKKPGLAPDHEAALRFFLPLTRTVFLYRPLLDVYRSFKSYSAERLGPPASDTCVSYAQSWLNGCRAWLAAEPRDEVMLIDYAVLSETPATFQALIERHFGLQNLNGDRLAQRSNKRVGQETLRVEPAALTEREQRIVEEAQTDLDPVLRACDHLVRLPGAAEQSPT